MVAQRNMHWWMASVVFLMAAFMAASPQAGAANATPYPGTQAVEANGMFVVTRASASTGAEGRGIKIAGNIVLGVYRNDFAVRMLAASVPAGIEAPLRFYITENADGTATLTYRSPGAIFAPYESAALDEMAAELDAIWAAIVKQTVRD